MNVFFSVMFLLWNVSKCGFKVARKFLAKWWMVVIKQWNKLAGGQTGLVTADFTIFW